MSYDEKTDHALDILSIRYIANTVDLSTTLGWEDFPEIGEGDWIEIVARAKKLVAESDVSQSFYQTAYDHLASRAGDEA